MNYGIWFKINLPQIKGSIAVAHKMGMQELIRNQGVVSSATVSMDTAKYSYRIAGSKCGNFYCQQ